MHLVSHKVPVPSRQCVLVHVWECVCVEGEGSVTKPCLSPCPVCRQQASVYPFSARSIKQPLTLPDLALTPVM